MRLFVNPTQDVLDALSDEDAFMFTSSDGRGPKVPGLVVYYPKVNGFRHSRFFKTFKAMEAELRPTEVIRMGNPGEVPLHENLADLAQWADYEAKVVEEAAAEITDPEIREAAEDQAEAMDEAAEALDKAAETAAETAAEVFVETGVPSDQNSEPVIAGNPSNLWSPWTVFVSDFGYIVARRTTGLGDWDKQEFVTDESGRIAYFNSKAEAEAIANEKNAVTHGNPIPVVSDVAEATGEALDTTAEAITPEVVQREIRESVAEDIAPEPTDWLFRPRFRKHG